MLTVISSNVNGIRAALRRGGVAQLAQSRADLICLQEVRANDDQLAEALHGTPLAAWHLAHAGSSQPGRAGVAVLSRTPLSRVRVGVGPAEFAESGRWLEATTETKLGALRVISTYVHTGEADTPRQAEKYRFLDAMSARLGQLARNATRTRSHALVCGDFNIAHTKADIKNWKGNIGKAGFLEPEREYLTSWGRNGWTDLGRRHAGDVSGPYTWWSWRGQAFDNDAGWRIDYALATRALAASLQAVKVGRAPSYAERWSDHAPVEATFESSARL